MKYLLILGILTLVSCGNGVKDWDMSDPNESSMMASNMVEPRYYSSDSTGLERRAMTDREPATPKATVRQEMRELTRNKIDAGVKFSGELSIGVASEL